MRLRRLLPVQRDGLYALMSSQMALASGMLSGVLLLSGTAKLIRPENFAAFLEQTIGERPRLRQLIRNVPAAELVVGVVILTPLATVGLVGATLLAGLFVVGSFAPAQSDHTGCGCFGSLDATDTARTFTQGRALLLLLLAAACLILGAGDSSRSPHTKRLSG